MLQRNYPTPTLIYRVSLAVILIFVYYPLSAQVPGGVSSTNFRAWFKADQGTFSNTTGSTAQNQDSGIVKHWRNLVPSAPIPALSREGTAVKLYNTSTRNMLNFNPVLNFQNTDLNHTSANILGGSSTGVHYIMIARPKTQHWNTTSSRRALLGNGSSGNEPAFDFEKVNNAPNGIRIWTGCSAITTSPNNGNTIYAGYGTGVGTSYNAVQNQPALWSSALQNFQGQVFGLGISGMTSSCSSTGTFSTYIDGYRITSAAKLTSSAAAGNGFYVASSGSERYPNLDIAEVIVYNTELAGNNLIKVESYLAIKYGITLGQGNNSVSTFNIGKNASNYNYLASDETVVWNNTIANTHVNNIAGIGIDTTSGLNQKQSASVNWNRSGQVTMSLGTTVAATNQANSNTFANDRNFLMWGDNSENTNTNTVSDPLETDYLTFTYESRSDHRRLKRVWQVQNTGVNQNVRIQFPIASVGTTGFPSESLCARYVLLSSADPSFNTGVTIVPLETVDTDYQATYTHPSGVSYFTFGKVDNVVPGLVNLPTVNRPNVSLISPCFQDAFTYYYAADDLARERKLFAINWQGNTPVSGLTGNIDYSATPHIVSAANTTHIMGRILGITPAGGSFTANGGVRVRFYYSPAELAASIVPDPTSEYWFKSPLTPSGVIASNNGTTIDAVPIIPSATGIENGVHFVEFSNITSFSSFGYVSHRILVILSTANLQITEAKEIEQCGIRLKWKTEMQQVAGDFDIEYSTNGHLFYSIGKSNADATEFIHRPSSKDNQRHLYRIKYVTPAGETVYSNIATVKNSCNKVKFTTAPNPVKAELTLMHLGEGQKNLKVVSSDGRTIYSAGILSHTFSVDASKWKSGIYTLIVEYSDQTKSIQRIVKE